MWSKGWEQGKRGNPQEYTKDAPSMHHGATVRLPTKAGCGSEEAERPLGQPDGLGSVLKKKS